MVRRRLSLPFTDVKEDDEVVADKEINNWKWKSYHEIDVKQNMGNGRYIHKIIQNNYNAKICQYYLDKYANIYMPIHIYIYIYILMWIS